MIVNSYNHSYKLNVITVRANNIYGIRQYPEKLISKTIFNFLKNKKMTIHGSGKSIRHFLSVNDFCGGLIKILDNGKPNTIYNIAANKSFYIMDIVKMISEQLEVDFKENIVFVKDRPFNDKIYKINCNKLKKLGWRETENLEKSIPEICEWYKKNLKLF